jgi:hypothetical protein
MSPNYSTGCGPMNFVIQTYPAHGLPAAAAANPLRLLQLDTLDAHPRLDLEP